MWGCDRLTSPKLSVFGMEDGGEDDGWETSRGKGVFGICLVWWMGWTGFKRVIMWQGSLELWVGLV